MMLEVRRVRFPMRIGIKQLFVAFNANNKLNVDSVVLIQLHIFYTIR